MPFGVRITGVPGNISHPLWIVNGIEYRINHMRDDKLFRLSVDSTLYADYVALLNVEEAIELHNKYRWVQNFPGSAEAERKLLNYLENGAQTTRWVIFEIYEYDGDIF